MKTIKNFMLVAFAATVFVACQKEEANNNDLAPKGEVVTFTGTVNGTETKTAIHYDENAVEFPTLFTTSDVIAVNGVKPKEDVSVSKDQHSITFEVEGVTPPYYAITGTHYQSFSDGVYAIQVSGTGAMQKFRTVADGEYVSFHSSSDILAAYSETESFQFKHLSTFYAITIDTENSTVTDNIKNIYVRQADGGNIAGNWTIKFENGSALLEPKSLTAFIGYDCGDEGVAQGTTMIVGLPAYDYESGLIFTIKDVNGKFASFMIPASKTQHAADGGKIIPFKPAFNPGAGVINSVADWNEFAEFVNKTPTNDWEIYRWIGDGSNTIKLGTDIEADDLTPIIAEFKYTLDGNGKTITRRNATKALFSTVSGTVKNLTLAGSFTATASQGDAPFVSTLAGGTISGCTNNMTITFDKADHTYVAGIVKMMTGGTIEGCVNNGTIAAKLSYTGGDKNVAVGGIVAQVNAPGEDIVIKDCLNKQAITFAPVIESSDNGSKVCGVGGIAGWLRAAKSFTLENCDNEGAVTYSAENVKDAAAPKNYPICVGGIIGIGSDVTKSLVDNGIALNMSACDNSGIIINRGISGTYVGTVTTVKRNSENRSFTGGIAGLLLGTSNSNVDISECTNTGEIIPYDLTGATASAQACYTSVVGGFIGFGGYLDMDDCTVNCTVGNGKRAVMSYGGVIGCAVRPFNLKDSYVFVKGFYQRIGNYQGNRAVVAAVPVLFGTTATNTMTIAPAIEGSTISNCNIGASVKTSSSALGTTIGEKTDDCSESLTTTIFDSEDKTKDNLVCGQGYDTVNDDVTVEVITYWNGN